MLSNIIFHIIPWNNSLRWVKFNPTIISNNRWFWYYAHWILCLICVAKFWVICKFLNGYISLRCCKKINLICWLSCLKLKLFICTLTCWHHKDKAFFSCPNTCCIINFSNYINSIVSTIHVFICWIAYQIMIDISLVYLWNLKYPCSVCNSGRYWCYKHLKLNITLSTSWGVCWPIFIK